MQEQPFTTVSASVARASFGEILIAVANQGQRYLVKRAEVPVAVLISLADFEALQALKSAYETRKPLIHSDYTTHGGADYHA